MSRTLTLSTYIIAAAIIAAIPLINWPFTWISTYFHEISHGIAALITGGRVLKIEMYLLGGGICQVQGGWSFLVAFSGYAGAVIWGASIYLAAEAMKPHNASLFAKCLAVMVGITLLLWARDIITILILAFIVLLFVTIAAFRSAALIRTLTQFTGIYVLLKSITSPLILIDGRHYGDGARLSDITMIPEIIWACGWMAIGVWGLVLVWRRMEKKAVA